MEEKRRDDDLPKLVDEFFKLVDELQTIARDAFEIAFTDPAAVHDLASRVTDAGSALDGFAFDLEKAQSDEGGES